MEIEMRDSHCLYFLYIHGSDVNNLSYYFAYLRIGFNVTLTIQSNLMLH